MKYRGKSAKPTRPKAKAVHKALHRAHEGHSNSTDHIVKRLIDKVQGKQAAQGKGTGGKGTPTTNEFTDEEKDEILELVINAFCPTGKGGGQKFDCPPSNKGTGKPKEVAPAYNPTYHQTAQNIHELKQSGTITRQQLIEHLSQHTVDELRAVRGKLLSRAKTLAQADRLKETIDKAIKVAHERDKRGPRTEPPSTRGPTSQPATGRGPTVQPARGAGVPTGEQRPTEPSKPVAPEAQRPQPTATDSARAGANQPVSGKVGTDVPGATPTTTHVPASIEEVNHRIDRMEKLFQGKGMHEQAEWMVKLRDHVNKVGTDEALRGLGEDKGTGTGQKVQYGGGWNDMGHFQEAYLNRHGIEPVYESAKSDPSKRLVSSLAPSKEGVEARGEVGQKHGDVFPTLPTLKDKLAESKALPGLEKSEDIHTLLGKQVTHFTPDVTAKLDEHYGKDGWIVKSYGEEAYAGYGVFFPQRVAALHTDAKSSIWSSGDKLAQYGFSHLRDDKNTIIGIKHANGDEYHFGTEKYNNTIHGDVRAAADNAAEAAPHEHATQLPQGSFMAQPAFKVVGVSDADRAAGKTWEGNQEGRVHIITRNGQAEIVPHSTWIKGEHLPVVFEDHNTRSMAQAALDAINALPHSEKQGQLYAPDVVKTETGHKAVEANPANEAGASGYLGNNPLIIDAYVSHLTGRTPAHVQFIRKLLTNTKSNVRNRGFRILFKRHTVEIPPSMNAFCPTGKGGGQDATCSPSSKGTGQQQSKPVTPTRPVAVPAKPVITQHPATKPPTSQQTLKTVPQASLIKRAYRLAKGTIQSFNKKIEELKAKGRGVPVLKWVIKATDFSKNLTQSFYKGLANRYGHATAMSVMATGQALGWGAMAKGIYLPLVSIWGSIPATAVAETFLQVGRAQRAWSKAYKVTFNTEMAVIGGTVDIDALAQEMIKTIANQYLKWIEDNKDELLSALSGMEDVEETPTDNAFCPTGKGGGQDNSCSSKQGGSDIGWTNEGVHPDTVFLRGMSQEAFAEFKKTGVMPHSHTANVFTTDLETAQYYASTKVHDELGVIVRFQVHPEDIKYVEMDKVVNQDFRITKPVRVRPGWEEVKHINNAFCPTGKGGNVDPHCSPSTKGTGKVHESLDQPHPDVGKPATAQEWKAAVKKAREKLKKVTPPTKEELKAAMEGVNRLGANKYRKNLIGNTQDRRKRREQLLQEFGNGKICPCIYCGIKIGHGTMEQDKIITTVNGGRYRMDNLVPACSGCNKHRSDKPFEEVIKKVKVGE